MIELKKLDRGESYCFEVQAYIPSRKPGKQLGAQSQTQCSKGEKSFTDGERETYHSMLVPWMTPPLFNEI